MKDRRRRKRHPRNVGNRQVDQAAPPNVNPPDPKDGSRWSTNMAIFALVLGEVTELVRLLT